MADTKTPLDFHTLFGTRRTQIQAIDDWRKRQPHLVVSRNEAMRRLIDHGLAATSEARMAEAAE